MKKGDPGRVPAIRRRDRGRLAGRREYPSQMAPAADGAGRDRGWLNSTETTRPGDKTDELSRGVFLLRKAPAPRRFTARKSFGPSCPTRPWRGWSAGTRRTSRAGERRTRTSAGSSPTPTPTPSAGSRRSWSIASTSARRCARRTAARPRSTSRSRSRPDWCSRAASTRTITRRRSPSSPGTSAPGMPRRAAAIARSQGEGRGSQLGFRRRRKPRARRGARDVARRKRRRGRGRGRGRRGARGGGAVHLQPAASGDAWGWRWTRKRSFRTSGRSVRHLRRWYQAVTVAEEDAAVGGAVRDEEAGDERDGDPGKEIGNPDPGKKTTNGEQPPLLPWLPRLPRLPGRSANGASP